MSRNKTKRSRDNVTVLVNCACYHEPTIAGNAANCFGANSQLIATDSIFRYENNKVIITCRAFQNIPNF